MAPNGSLRLFRALGVDVYLHWSWFLFAFLQVEWQLNANPPVFAAPVWSVVFYVTIFALVLLHEFGHVLACRQVGGEANTIVLWPLGGVALVSPPPRAGAVLWSIVAGPLVNVALLAPLFVVALYPATPGPERSDAAKYLLVVAQMNAGMLVLNLLPIYPLDGGQILMAVLWFWVGRWTALLVAAVVGAVFGGVVFVVGLVSFAATGVVFFLILSLLAVIIVRQSMMGVRVARHFLYLESLPRHLDCACPACKEAPPKGTFWVCEHCETRFDLFDTRGQCPSCNGWYLEPACPFCQEENRIHQWYPATVAPDGPAGGPRGAESPGRAGERVNEGTEQG